MRIVLFDGVCNLCSGSVQFIIRNDPKKKFHFAPLQSDLAMELLGNPEHFPDSVVLIDHGKIYVRSTAGLRIAAGLRGLYPLFQVFYLVPRPLRDLVYDFISRRRYKWFGEKESCMIPSPDILDRFLDQA